VIAVARLRPSNRVDLIGRVTPAEDDSIVVPAVDDASLRRRLALRGAGSRRAHAGSGFAGLDTSRRPAVA
jgi:hypothetical protein